MKIKKHLSVEFFVIYFNILVDLIQIIIILNNKKLIGDFLSQNYNISSTTIIFLFIIQVFFYVCTYKFYVNLIKKRKFFISGFNFDDDLYFFIDYFVLLLILINFLFYYINVVNIAGSYNPSAISFIIHIVSIDAIFPFYYFLNRNKNNNLIYFLNIAFFVIFVLLRGYSGILLNIFIYELYFRLKRKVNLGYLILLPFFMIILGIFLYQYVFPIKTALRFNRDIFSVSPLTFKESAEIFMGRLSMMGNLIAIIQYKENILHVMNQFLPHNFELLRFIRMQIPSFISDKIFSESIFYGYNIGNILGSINIYDTTFGSLSSHSIGSSLLGTLYLLLLRNPIELILYCIFSLFIILYIKVLLDIFKNNDIYFPFFIIIISFIHETGDTALSFGNLFFSLTVFIFMLLLIKVMLLKFKIKNQ